MGAEVRWGMEGISKIRSVCYGCAVMALLALPSAAQLDVGDNLHMNLSGTVGFNYAGDIDQGASDHGMGFTGNGTLTGSYYSPNFLNFNVSPFYNRMQSDSTFGSLTNATGVSSSVNLFNGKPFPRDYLVQPAIQRNQCIWRPGVGSRPGATRQRAGIRRRLERAHSRLADADGELLLQ